MDRRSGLVVIPAVVLALALILVPLAIGCEGTPATSSSPEKTTEASAQSPGSPTTASSNGQDQAQVDSIESQFKQDLGTTSFTLTQAALTRDANGNWQLLTKLQVPSVEVANASIQEVMGWIEARAAALNRGSQVKLAGLHVYIQTPSGQMVVDWTEDLAGGTATGNWASGITNYWFPSPPPAESTTANTGSQSASPQTSSTMGQTSATTTTLPPGVMTFATCTHVFEELLEKEKLPGTLPYTVMAPAELVWLSADTVPVEFTNAKGYRFADGDLIILFYYASSPGGDDWYRTTQRALTAVAKKQYAHTGKDVLASFPYIDEFGYVEVTTQGRGNVGGLAEKARTGEGTAILSGVEP